jgi:PPP family 3-phenylpropionic acid transporter
MGIGARLVEAVSRLLPPPPAARLSAFYAASFLVAGIQLPFWPVWLAGRGLDPYQIGLVLAAAIWANVVMTPAFGALADRLGRPQAVMAGLAAIALVFYLALGSAAGFWAVLSLNLIAATAQSALMPLGDSVTLASARATRLDYGRVRLWGPLSFILAAVAGGSVLAAHSADRVLVLVLAASARLLLACVAMPRQSAADRPAARRAGVRGLVANRRFWLFVATAAALQASHQVYYGFGTLYWRRLGVADPIIGGLWAEGVVAEIVLFWQGRPLLVYLGPIGLMALGGGAGIIRWSLSGFVSSLPLLALLQLLHAFTFGASHLGAMHFLSRAVPPAVAASAQTLYAAASSGLGSGLVMLAAGGLYTRYGGPAYLFMAALSASGFAAALALRRAARRTPSLMA